MDKGFVIAFEGGEGSGKSTALPLFEQLLKEKGFKVKTYAEPGGTDYAQAVRQLFFANPDLSVKAAVHLINSQRQDNIDTIIKPHIDDGYIVLIDRFVASTIVYQGLLSDNLGDVTDKDEQLEWVLANTLTYDHVVFFFDCPPEVSMSRLLKRDGNNHFDDLSLDKHALIYNGYKEALDSLANSASFRESELGQIVTQMGSVPYVPGCIGVLTIDSCESVSGVTEQLRICVDELVEQQNKTIEELNND